MNQLVPAVLLALAASLPGGQDPAPEEPGTEGGSPELLWPLLEQNEQTPEVIEALRLRLHETDDAETLRVIDTILNHWQVPHEEIPRWRYLARPGALVPPEAICPWPVEPLTGKDGELVKLLAPTDPKLRERAAFTLITRGRHHHLALRALLPNLSDHAWVPDVAGAALGEAIGIELAEATSDSERLHLLQLLRETSSCEDAIDEVMALIEREDQIGRKARELVLINHGIQLWSDQDWVIHSYLLEGEINDPDIQSRLVKVALLLVDEKHADPAQTREALHSLHLCGLRSAAVREAVSRPLIELLRETGSLHVLQILCHFGSGDALVRSLYLETLRGWNGTTGAELDSLPCWKHHDEETLAAFDRVFTRAERKLDLVDRLAFAGLIDSSENDITRRFFEDLETETSASSWAWLRDKGFCHVARLVPGESEIIRVNKLGLAIATLKARGEDYSEYADDLAEILKGGYDLPGAGGYADHYQWGFSHAVDLDLRGPEFVEAALRVFETGFPRDFSTHTEYARVIVAEAELTAEQAARLAAVPTPPGGEQEWHGFSLLPTDRQEVPGHVTRLREIPRIRTELYRGNAEWLANLCAITPLISRDEGYLLALLSRGRCWQKRRALEMIRDHELDSPAIRAAVSDRTRDCDHRIREQADRIIDARGW